MGLFWELQSEVVFFKLFKDFYLLMTLLIVYSTTLGKPLPRVSWWWAREGAPRSCPNNVVPSGGAATHSPTEKNRFGAQFVGKCVKHTNPGAGSGEEGSALLQHARVAAEVSRALLRAHGSRSCPPRGRSPALCGRSSRSRLQPFYKGSAGGASLGVSSCPSW